jgi:phosphate transport system protein
MSADHTVKSFDQELRQLEKGIVELGELTAQQFAASLESITARDTKFSARIMENDSAVDERALEVDNHIVRLLALRQPVALDLRNILAALRISIDLERIADYAFNVAERTLYLTRNPPSNPVQTIVHMGRCAQEMLHDVLDAYRSRDVIKACEVWSRDRKVDSIYSQLLVDLRAYMIKDPLNIDACTDLLFMTKSIERVGDHIKNIAEHIYYAVQGTQLHEAETLRSPSMSGLAMPQESVR